MPSYLPEGILTGKGELIREEACPLSEVEFKAA